MPRVTDHAGARRPTRERGGLLRWTGYPHQTGRGCHALDDRSVRHVRLVKH
jgi:hypothetical protein